MPNAVKPPARPRRHEARRADDSWMVRSGRYLPTSHCGTPSAARICEDASAAGTKGAAKQVMIAARAVASAATKSAA